MEMLDAILDLAKIIFAPIHDYCNNHRHFDEHMKKLGNTKQDLNSRKSDIESSMRAQLRPGMTPKSEVDTWLQAVERMINEIQAIESEAEEVKWFLRARIGKHALEKKPEADELYQKGGDFPDSLVIDPPVRNGEEFPTTELIGKSTTERVKEKILAYLLGNDVRKIGVYGMGGIGKSTIMEHINNHLLKDNKIFASVIWVTVSKSSDVLQLQNAIAHKLAVDLAKSEYKRERAAKIKEELEKREKYVLILDDLWKGFSLEEVGIPEPTPENGCKIVLTTRDRNVCKTMGCEVIGMKLLSKEEARELFSHKIEKDVFNTPNLKAIAEEVLQTCAQLPLAIVATAASFKCLDYEYQWTDALDQLSTSLKGFDNIEDRVHEVLKFSYVRLKEEKLKQCLLHCALYPKTSRLTKKS